MANLANTAKVVNLTAVGEEFTITVNQGERRPLDILCTSSAARLAWHITYVGDNTNTVFYAGLFTPEDAIKRMEVTLYNPGSYTLVTADATNLTDTSTVFSAV